MNGHDWFEYHSLPVLYHVIIYISLVSTNNAPNQFKFRVSITEISHIWRWSLKCHRRLKNRIRWFTLLSNSANTQYIFPINLNRNHCSLCFEIKWMPWGRTIHLNEFGKQVLVIRTWRCFHDAYMNLRASSVKAICLYESFYFTPSTLGTIPFLWWTCMTSGS